MICGLMVADARLIEEAHITALLCMLNSSKRETAYLRTTQHLTRLISHCVYYLSAVQHFPASVNHNESVLLMAFAHCTVR